MDIVVYGELSILGYNGYIPNVERNGRRNRSKFLLCKRSDANGIKKSKHYIVKQPQATKAIQDKDLHSISYTFSRSQTIIVEYSQDEDTDMFQIGRSSEDPIDFVVMDTLPAEVNISSSGGCSNGDKHLSSSSSRYHHSENNSSGQQQIMAANDMLGMNRFHRHLVKVGEELAHYAAAPISQPPAAHDPTRNRIHYHRQQAQAVLLNYPQPNISNLPHVVAEHFRSQDSSGPYQAHNHHNHNHHGHSSNAPQQIFSLSRPDGSNHHQHLNQPNITDSNNHHDQQHSSRHNIICKRSHTTQSTISRFACRILVDRTPPYVARIYAAGFDSSKNIFLGEKATKWEQNNSIDGLTTNGVLLMHPKQGNFYNDLDEQLKQDSDSKLDTESEAVQSGDSSSVQTCSTDEPNNDKLRASSALGNNNISSNSEQLGIERCSSSKGDGKTYDDNKMAVNRSVIDNSNDSNNNNKTKGQRQIETGGVWREVSVDGGIYAIRETRSAAQKGTRIERESNILRDGTLIDLCGATLLWRSVDGFKASPTKKSLEEKIDMLNASRPQCPVGLNTLVIPRKPILPTNQHRISHKDNHSHHHHHNHHQFSNNGNNSKDNDKNSHQPYVYLKCGHVQGYHDWGTTEESNQRTCPICLSVGTVAKLSMGLEPSFYVDSGPLTHVFSPCGHMASERTVKYWCSIKIPHGTHFFHSICPFCATPLAANEPAFTKLIFQDDLD